MTRKRDDGNKEKKEGTTSWWLVILLAGLGLLLVGCVTVWVFAVVVQWQRCKYWAGDVYDQNPADQQEWECVLQNMVASGRCECNKDKLTDAIVIKFGTNVGEYPEIVSAIDAVVQRNCRRKIGLLSW